MGGCLIATHSMLLSLEMKPIFHSLLLQLMALTDKLSTLFCWVFFSSQLKHHSPLIISHVWKRTRCVLRSMTLPCTKHLIGLSFTGRGGGGR